MKIVQINSVCGVGSTGRIAVDIAEAAEKRGHTCYIAYGHGTTKYPHSYHIGNSIEHLFHNLFFTRILGLHGFGSIITTRLFTNWLDSIHPDIIHIHNIHANYINYRLLFEYIIKKQIPVVFTLHDCFNFTGKCTYYTSVKCSKYISGCAKCTNYRKTGAPSLFFDNSALIYKQKKSLYSRIESLDAIAVSKWLMHEAEKSILGGYGHRIRYIYNWIDSEKFKPASLEEKEEFYSKYHLSKDYKYLISVSQLWEKGSIRYNDAVTLAHKLPQGYKLLIVGGLGRKTVVDPLITHIKYTSSQSELAIAYSIAEAYVHFSVQDTFGLVIGEAMACGTIPITYNSTACAEVPGGFGIVVEPRDIDAIVKSLPLIEEKKKYSTEMIEYVKNNYDKKANTNKYVDVYEHLIN